MSVDSARSSPTDATSKRQNQSPKDRLTDLPDSILCHILSFLPTKDAVATSLLSKKWNHLWTFLPNLDFDETSTTSSVSGSNNEYEAAQMRFLQFVYRVLLLNKSPRIQRLRVKCGANSKFDTSHLDAWVYLATQRQVEEIEIGKGNLRRIKLPDCLFPCATLVVLKLSGEMVINAPSSICLPNLKTLHLSYVNYANNASYSNLVTKCPVLENLDICDEVPEVAEVVRVCSQTLKNLTFKLEFEDGTVDKLEIDAPALEYIDIKDTASYAFSMQNLTSLVTAKVEVFCFAADMNLYGDEGVEVIRGLYNVRSLFLSLSTMEVLGNAMTKSESLFFSRNNMDLMFHNLTKLEMEVRCYNLYILLPFFLERSHNLGVLVINKDCAKKPGSLEDKWQHPQHVPICLLLHLRTIDFKGFDGSKEDLKLIGYLLNKAKVLRKMTILCSSLNLREKFRVLKKLSMIRRASKTCQVAFR